MTKQRAQRSGMQGFAMSLLLIVFVFVGCSDTSVRENDDRQDVSADAQGEVQVESNMPAEPGNGDVEEMVVEDAEENMNEDMGEGDEPAQPEDNTAAEIDASASVDGKTPIVNVDSNTEAEMQAEEAPAEPMVRTFNLSGVNFAFKDGGVENPTLRVKKGERVVINFVSDAGFHDWRVDAFDAATQAVKAGETTSVSFIADEAGTFEYYCSIGSHRANGMEGQLIVE